MKAECHDCGLPYTDPGFADLVVPHDVWLKISPTGHEGGLLCPTCMVRRGAKAGLVNIQAVFKSGPFCSDSGMLVFVVNDPKGEFVYVFDNHDAALRCRRDLKLTHWQLRGCSVSADWQRGQPVRAADC